MKDENDTQQMRDGLPDELKGWGLGEKLIATLPRLVR